MPPRLFLCCLVVAFGCSGAEGPSPAGDRALWFEAGRLIAGDGSEPVEHAAVLVEGDTIAWAGRRPRTNRPMALSGSTCPARR